MYDIMGTQKNKGYFMAEKRLKTKSVRVRISNEKFEALNKYVKDKKISKTDLIDSFLTEILKDYSSK
jgi:hypothetical protein